MPFVSTLDLAEVKRLHAQGLNDVEIGKALNAHRQTIAQARARLDLPPQDKSTMARAAGRKGGRPAQQGMAEHLATQQEIARQMHGDGKKNREIAQCLEVSTSRVSQILRGMGLASARTPGRGITVHTTSSPIPPPNNGAALRQVRAQIIRGAWARVVERKTSIGRVFLPIFARPSQPQGSHP